MNFNMTILIEHSQGQSMENGILYMAMRVSLEGWDGSQVASCREYLTLKKSVFRILSLGAKKVFSCRIPKESHNGHRNSPMNAASGSII